MPNVFCNYFYILVVAYVRLTVRGGKHEFLYCAVQNRNTEPPSMPPTREGGVGAIVKGQPNE